MVEVARTANKRPGEMKRVSFIGRPTNLNYKVLSAKEVGRSAAKMVMDIARTGQGTVLTPGCNTPREMYRELALQGKEILPPLLKGEKGGLFMGMIDGVEWPVDHPYSFRHYFIQQFLGAFAAKPLSSTENGAQSKAAIQEVYNSFKNVFVPHIPRDGELVSNIKHETLFDLWLEQRLPIDLMVLGLGPDGHIAFLGPQTEYRQNELPAKRIKLWEEIRDWKWVDESEETCQCVQDSCDLVREAPEYALTVSLSTILNAKKIVLMAMGYGKARAVLRLIAGELEPYSFTAHHLVQVKDKVTVLLDEPAARLL